MPALSTPVLTVHPGMSLSLQQVGGPPKTVLSAPDAAPLRAALKISPMPRFAGYAMELGGVDAT